VKAIALVLPIAVVLGLAACDRPARTTDKSDPARESVALRPTETTPRPDKAAPQPAQPVQSTADAKSDTPATDAALSEKVRQALVSEHGLNARDLQVNTRNGVVTLSGKVEEKSDQERMLLVAMSIDGVRSVVSNLVVDRPA
jgi:hyperosmotically inducible periplasmic protein